MHVTWSINSDRSVSSSLVPMPKGVPQRIVTWTCWVDDAEWLTQYSVLFRYPGESAMREDARQAVRIVKAMRPNLRAALGLTAED